MPRPKGSRNRTPEEREAAAADKATKKTEKKSRAPQAPGSVPGHNALSDEDEKRLHQRHVSEYESALTVKKTADADLKNVAKRIKAEGGSVASVKRTIALRTPEGEAAFKAEMAEMAKLARWSGVGIQLDLLEVAEPNSIDRAALEGLEDGRAARSLRTDYAPGTPEYDAYMESWHKGQAENGAGIKAPATAPARADDSFDEVIDDAGDGDGDVRPRFLKEGNGAAEEAPAAA